MYKSCLERQFNLLKEDVSTPALHLDKLDANSSFPKATQNRASNFVIFQGHLYYSLSLTKTI